MTWTFDHEGVECPAILTRADGPSHGLLVLGHSAGGSMDSKLTSTICAAMNRTGLDVVRFNFPYRAQGKHIPDRMPALLKSFQSAIDSARSKLPFEKLYLGGHSMGGRTATMLTAEGCACDGLILFGYPLHPAGKEDKLRNSHFPDVHVPVFCANGTKDDLCREELMTQALKNVGSAWEMVWVPGANHSLEVPKSTGKSQTDIVAELSKRIEAWLNARER